MKIAQFYIFMRYTGFELSTSILIQPTYITLMKIFRPTQIERECTQKKKNYIERSAFMFIT